jgi:hypothetical protein
MKQVIRKKTVNVKFTLPKGIVGGKTKITFQDDEDLRNVQLWGVQTFYRGAAATGLNNGVLPTDLDYTLPLLQKDLFLLTHLNLLDINNVNFLKDSPFVLFQTIQNNWSKGGNPNFTNPDGTIAERDTKYFTGQRLDLQNSFIEMATAGFPNTQDEQSIVINFYYSRLDLDSNALNQLKWK